VQGTLRSNAGESRNPGQSGLRTQATPYFF